MKKIEFEIECFIADHAVTWRMIAWDWALFVLAVVAVAVWPLVMGSQSSGTATRFDQVAAHAPPQAVRAVKRAALDGDQHDRDLHYVEHLAPDGGDVAPRSR